MNLSLVLVSSYAHFPLFLKGTFRRHLLNKSRCKIIRRSGCGECLQRARKARRVRRWAQSRWVVPAGPSVSRPGPVSAAFRSARALAVGATGSTISTTIRTTIATAACASTRVTGPTCFIFRACFTVKRILKETFYILKIY